MGRVPSLDRSEYKDMFTGTHTKQNMDDPSERLNFVLSVRPFTVRYLDHSGGDRTLTESQFKSDKRGYGYE